jgi:hypothetical protein
MSWNRMNHAERMRWLIGEAVLRHLDDGPTGEPELLAELAAVRRILMQRLEDDAFHRLVAGAGWDVEGVCGTGDADDDGQGVLQFPPPGGFTEREIPA